MTDYMNQIKIYEPYLNDEILKYAHDALNSSWISSNGKYLDLVSEKLKIINNRKHVILCSNGTTATHLMALGLNFKYPKIKNIIVPNNVFVAAWNSFLVNPIYNLIPIDSDIKTWNFDLYELDKAISEKSPDDTAILLVHNIGNIINLIKLKEKYPNWIFLEDNCEGFLGSYEGMPSGSKSFLSSVSFFGNKIITSGEGGAIFIDDDDTYEYLNSVKSQGLTKTKFLFDKLGYNYRMTNIEAAILYGQLEILEEIIEKKRQIVNLYKENLIGFKFQTVEINTKHSNWMVGIDLENKINSHILIHKLENYIETRPMFPVIDSHKHLSNLNNKNNNSNYLYNNVIILPSHLKLNEETIAYISKKIISLI